MSNMIADRYMVVTSLGEGGMADVFLAMDTILNREVAVKVLRGELSEDPVALLRFLREASAVSKLHHPNVVEVYDVGEYDGKNYIVMEYIRGRTLKQLISQRGALQKEEAIEIMKQLVSAINHAHEHNIIHRDIKPQNILMKDDGTVKITDFGIALAHDAIQLTQSDAVLGSAHYIAPETTKGEVASVQTDIYALGVVFYELLTGTVPFKGENPIQVAMKHLREDIPSVRVFNPTLPQSIENVIVKATAKNRLKRYATTKDMLFDLEMCLLPEFSNVDPVDLINDDDDGGTVVLGSLSDLGIDDQTVEMEDNEIKKVKTKPSKSSKSSKDIKKAKNKKIMIIVASVVGVLVLVFGGLAISGAFSGASEDKQEVKKVKVPDLMGLSEVEVVSKLKKVGLKLDTDILEEVTDDIEKGLVIKQSVTKNKQVKKGTKITITISSGKYFVVSNYVGMGITDAQNALASTTIEVLIEYKETEDYAPGTIISQSLLSSGTKVEPGKAKQIKFIVAQEKTPEKVMFTVENYVGQNCDYIRGQLEGKKITIIIVEVELTQKDKDEGKEERMIISQDLAAGTTFDLAQPKPITFKVYGPMKTDES